MANIHVGDVGAKLKSQVVDQDGNIVNISGYRLTMTLRKPDSTYLYVTPLLLTDGTDGYMAYTTQAGDLTNAGDWQRQGAASGVGSPYWLTDVTQFQVLPNL
jgi:hypothetical protein